MAGKPKPRAPEPEEAVGEGVGIWYISYGDMVTLLLAMFVLLFSFSTLEKEKFAKVVQTFQEIMGAGRPSTGGVAENRTEGIYVPNPVFKSSSDVTKLWGTLLENLGGYEAKVTTVREGTKITIGGKVSFDLGKSELKEEVRPMLDKIASLVQGYRNKIEIRGHCALTQKDTLPGENGRYLLSYYRALAVSAYLSEVSKLEPRCFRVTACGSNERGPVSRDDRYREEDITRDMRVEIIVSEELTPYD